MILLIRHILSSGAFKCNSLAPIFEMYVIKISNNIKKHTYSKTNPSTRCISLKKRRIDDLFRRMSVRTCVELVNYMLKTETGSSKHKY